MGNVLPVSATTLVDAFALLILEKLVVTVCGSCVVASFGNDEELVETDPACSLVSAMVPNEPLDPTTLSATEGLVEY